MCGRTDNKKMKKIHIFLLLAALGIHLLFWNSLITGFLNPLFNDTSHRVGAGGDFFQFYQAGSDLLKKVSIYQTEGKVIDVPYAALYKYPPFLAYTVGIFAQLFSVWTAYKIWVAVIACFFAVMLLFIHKILDDQDTFFWSLLLSLIFTPYYIDLYMGQTNTLMAMLIAGIMYSFARKKKKLSILLLGLSMNIKLNTAFFIPVYSGKNKYKLLVFAVLLSAVLFVPYFMFFPKDFSYFMKYVFGGASDYFYQAGNVGMYPLIREFTYHFTYNSGLSNWIQALWALIVVSFTLWFQFSLKNKKKDDLDLISLWLCAFFLSYKFIWEHHLVMLIPVLALELKRNNKKVIGFLWLVLAMPTIFYFVNVDMGKGYTEVQRLWTQAQSVWYHFFKITPVFFIYLCLILRLRGAKIAFYKIVVPYLAVMLTAMSFYGLKPLSAKDYIAMAKRANIARDYNRADKYFQRAVNIDPYYIDTWMEYAGFLSHTGKHEKARECIAQAYRLNPDHEFFKGLLNK